MIKAKATALFAAGDRYEALRKEIRSNGFVKDFGVQFQRKDGTLIDCLFTAHLLTHAQDETEGYQGIIRDVMAQKQAEQKIKAQKATEIMNVGRGQLVHVEAPKAHVISRCLNEATDFAASSAGRAHVHLVLILDKDGNVAMGKMKMNPLNQEGADVVLRSLGNAGSRVIRLSALF